MEMEREKPDLNARMHEVPHRPGVYLMRDRLGRVIYVGKAKDLRRRMSQYFQPSRSRLADLKTRALIRSIWDFEFRLVKSEPEALLLEVKLIKEYRPRYNVSFRDDKRYLLLKVHPDEPWPRFSLTRNRKDDGARYFGPFAHSGSLRATLQWMHQRFGLRSCRPLRPGAADYRHCHDDIIRNCSAPCIGRITQEEYRKRVEEACGFLDGRFREHVKEIEDAMRAAAEALDFERAADLRDMLDDFRKTLKPVRRFVRGRGTPSEAIRPQDDLRELAEALDLPEPPAVMECFDISNISSSHIVASMVLFRNGVPDTASYRRYRITTVRGQNDFASMAEVVRRRYTRILAEATAAAPDDFEGNQESGVEAMRRLERATDAGNKDAKRAAKPARLPNLVIVDGGRGQLSSACAELQRLGLHGLPVIGLAKEREEIYRPDSDLPLLLPDSSGALKLLQRIRDEAHRWANGYHQVLMKRRISESILDECPGVSAARKKALLRAFGSVPRLRRQPAEAIAKVPGVGPRLAADIVDWLKTH